MMFLNAIWFIVLFGWLGGLIFWTLGSLLRLIKFFRPIGVALIELAKLVSFPFGKEIIREEKDKTKYNKWANIIWFPLGLIFSLAFLIMAIESFIAAVILTVLVITFPFAALAIANGVVFIKLAYFVISPVGLKVVSRKEAYAKAVVEELKKEKVVE